MWLVKFSKQAAKDAKKLKSAKLDMKAKSLIEIVREDPFTSQPSYETLVGQLIRALFATYKYSASPCIPSHSRTNLSR